MKTLRNIVFGTLLALTGAGIATPLAYNLGEDAGRESARPVRVDIDKVAGSDSRWFRYYEGAIVRDASGRSYSLWNYRNPEITHKEKNWDASIVTTSYHDHCIDRCDHDHAQ